MEFLNAAVTGNVQRMLQLLDKHRVDRPGWPGWTAMALGQPDVVAVLLPVAERRVLDHEAVEFEDTRALFVVHQTRRWLLRRHWIRACIS